MPGKISSGTSLVLHFASSLNLPGSSATPTTSISTRTNMPFRILYFTPNLRTLKLELKNASLSFALHHTAVRYEEKLPHLSDDIDLSSQKGDGLFLELGNPEDDEEASVSNEDAG